MVSRSRGVLLGLAAFLAVDVALVVFALDPSRSVATAPGTSAASLPSSPSPGSTPTPPSPTTTRTPSATSTRPSPPPASQQPTPAPLLGSLVAASDTVAWRTTTGSCANGGASVAVSTDGGRAWTTRAVPVQVLIRVRPSTAASAFVVGAGRDCKPELRSTTDGGATWGPTSGTTATWFRDPQDPQLVHSPGARSNRPCGPVSVIDLAPVTATSARVLCSDGSIQGSSNSGSTWSAAGSTPGALALDARAESGVVVSYVVRTGESCGLQVVRVAGTPTQTTVLGCVEPEVPVPSGSVALSVNGPAGWMQVGGTTWRSRDGLLTWSPA